MPGTIGHIHGLVIPVGKESTSSHAAQLSAVRAHKECTVSVWQTSPHWCELAHTSMCGRPCLGGACFGLCVWGDRKHLKVHFPEEVERDACGKCGTKFPIGDTDPNGFHFQKWLCERGRKYCRRAKEEREGWCLCFALGQAFSTPLSSEVY